MQPVEAMDVNFKIDTNIDIELPEWMIEKITPEY